MKIEDLLFIDNYSKTWEFKRIKSKVKFYNNCGILTKILYGLIYGKNFIPLKSERMIMDLYEEYSKDSRVNKIGKYKKEKIKHRIEKEVLSKLHDGREEVEATREINEILDQELKKEGKKE